MAKKGKKKPIFSFDTYTDFTQKRGSTVGSGDIRIQHSKAKGLYNRLYNQFGFTRDQALDFINWNLNTRDGEGKVVIDYKKAQIRLQLRLANVERNLWRPKTDFWRSAARVVRNRTSVDLWTELEEAYSWGERDD